MWNLESLGFGASEAASLAAYAADGVIAGRVAVVHREESIVLTEAGELRAGLAGRFRHESEERPATGDWVAVRPWPGEARATLVAVLPRRTRLSRKTAGRTTREQVVAANMDSVLLVCGLDGDFNLRRIERALVVAWESGAAPVVILSKADLCHDTDARRAAAQSVAAGVPVHAISALGAEGLDALAPYLARGRTVVLVGSSGAGKSTLTNALLGYDRQATHEVRVHDSRGRHTTTTRELISLPSGGWIIDTPGLRELQLWAEDEATIAVFDDITALAASCRFRDCAHEAEPGCAVRAAAASGGLDAARLASHQKLERELRHLAARQDAALRQAEKQKARTRHRAARRLYRTRDGGKRGA